MNLTLDTNQIAPSSIVAFIVDTLMQCAFFDESLSMYQQPFDAMVEEGIRSHFSFEEFHSEIVSAIDRNECNPLDRATALILWKDYSQTLKEHPVNRGKG